MWLARLRRVVPTAILLAILATPALTAQTTLFDLDSLRAARGLPLRASLLVAGVPLGDAERALLKLERFAVFAADAMIVVHKAGGEQRKAPPDNAFFRGRVEGDPSSNVFLSVRDDGGVLGLIVSQGRVFLLGGGAPEVGPLERLEIREVGSKELAALRPTLDCGSDQLPAHR